MKIKNWTNRQTFRKDRPPTWIRLYFDLLNNFPWAMLSGEQAKFLVELWLIAAQHDPQGGELPEAEEIAFRLRRAVADVRRMLLELDGEWVTGVENVRLPNGCQAVTEEKNIRLPKGCIEIEEEIEKRREEILLIEKADTADRKTPSRVSVVNDTFETFWKAYPRKVGKPNALKAWKSKKLNESIDIILASLERWKASRDWTKDGGQFIPHPATWLNREGWNDEVKASLYQDDDNDINF